MPKKDWMVKESGLDDDQHMVLNAILDKSCIVSGCAGSGKSVLALIKAQRIEKEKGNNYQVIIYTKSLSNYMNAGREELGLSKPFIYHWQWKNKLAMPSADYTIVDEIQDFTEEEIGEFLQSTRKHFFFFGDSAQSIYNGMNGKTTLPVEDIMFSFPNVRQCTESFKLYRNYRLPLPVAKLAQFVGENLPPLVPSIYQSRENQLPYLLRFEDEDSQIEAIVKIIKDRGLSDVGIFMPHNDGVKKVRDCFNNKGLSVEVKYAEDGRTIDTLNFKTQLPKIMTYHSAKGLQFETVFLPFLPTNIVRRSPLYVAMTRTYHYLYLMYDVSMPDLFTTVPKDLYLNTTDVVIEDI